MDAAFPLTHQCKLINASLVSSPPILVSMGVRKSMRTPLALLVSPVIMFHTIGGLDSELVSRDKYSNMLKK